MEAGRTEDRSKAKDCAAVRNVVHGWHRLLAQLRPAAAGQGARAPVPRTMFITRRDRIPTMVRCFSCNSSSSILIHAWIAAIVFLASDSPQTPAAAERRPPANGIAPLAKSIVARVRSWPSSAFPRMTIWQCGCPVL
jgi:hypothetical protein